MEYIIESNQNSNNQWTISRKNSCKFILHRHTYIHTHIHLLSFLIKEIISICSALRMLEVSTPIETVSLPKRVLPFCWKEVVILICTYTHVTYHIQTDVFSTYQTKSFKEYEDNVLFNLDIRIFRIIYFFKFILKTKNFDTYWVFFGSIDQATTKAKKILSAHAEPHIEILSPITRALESNLAFFPSRFKVLIGFSKSSGTITTACPLIRLEVSTTQSTPVPFLHAEKEWEMKGFTKARWCCVFSRIKSGIMAPHVDQQWSRHKFSID